MSNIISTNLDNLTDPREDLGWVTNVTGNATHDDDIVYFPPIFIDTTVNEVFTNNIDLSKVSSFLEPCKGNGIIYDKIDCSIKTYSELNEEPSKDYLTTTYGKFDLIITNPPFSLAKEFLEKSIKEADCVCYLLRLNFLGSQKRKPFWEDISTPDELLVLSKRPSFTGKGTDATDYAWFCWDKNNTAKKGF